MSECIKHTGGLDKDGYGRVQYNKVRYRAHRLAYILANKLSSEDIQGVVIRHTCDNRKCVNPEHLEAGTHQDNMDDMRQRGRAAKGVVNGNAVLQASDVISIRDTYVYGCPVYGGSALAKKYGVYASTISKIVRNQTWRHV